MARHFERGASSFRAFVEKLEDDAERGEADEAPIVEEGVEGVRVMTVHKAKGLEFPVVVLADPTCNAARDTPSRYVDPSRRLWVEPLCGSAPIELLEAANEELRLDQAEAVRVAYVAATRARDLLVAPVCGDEPIEGWLDVLNPALYPPEDSRRNSDRADGCPSFGEDSVLERGAKGVPPLQDRSALVSIQPLRGWTKRCVVGPVRAFAGSGGAYRASPSAHPGGRSRQAAPLLKASKITPLGKKGGQIYSAGRLSPRSLSRPLPRSLARKGLLNWGLSRLSRSS